MKNLTCALEVHGLWLESEDKNTVLRRRWDFAKCCPKCCGFLSIKEWNNNPSLLLLHMPGLALAYKASRCRICFSRCLPQQGAGLVQVFSDYLNTVETHTFNWINCFNPLHLKTKGKGNNIIKVVEIVSLIQEKQTIMREDLCTTCQYFPQFLCMWTFM